MKLEDFDPNAGFKKCPYCAEMVLAEAEICRYCKRNINPVAIQAEKIRTVSFALLQLGCGLIIFGIVLYWIIIDLIRTYAKVI
jgi:hypothetical protein